VLLARVVGNVWGARQAESLQGYRLLVAEPLSAPVGALRAGAERPRTLPRKNLVVVDRLGAGPGELVLVAHGTRCRDLTLGASVATKEVTVAIVDQAEVCGELVGGDA
jgi:microcompartment protein CcmK/EutM